MSSSARHCRAKGSELQGSPLPGFRRWFSTKVTGGQGWRIIGARNRSIGASPLKREKIILKIDCAHEPYGWRLHLPWCWAQHWWLRPWSPGAHETSDHHAEPKGRRKGRWYKDERPGDYQ
jgi:hypothetical protein